MSESKKYGFTMVELLGVILIIGVLALLLIPLINKSLIESKQKLYDSQIKNIELSAESWAMDHLFELPETEEETMTIYLWQLKIGGYIDNNVSDPKTGKLFPNDMEITIKKQSKRYVYNAIEDSGTEGNVDISNTTTPIIVLNGDPEVTVHKGETYVDMGAIAFYNGEDITSQIITTNTVNTQAEGTYYIRYNINYNGKQAKEVTRTVNVIATTIIAKTFTEIMEPLLGTEVNNNDPDGNLRYVGADPGNYVWFNKELWRIIGVFNGQAKIIRDDYYSTSIAWNTNGTNDWTEASLKNELNGVYLNSIQVNDVTSYNYIDLNYLWYICGTLYEGLSSNQAYYDERCIDYDTLKVYDEPVTWTGAIGVMYATDYDYSLGSSSWIFDNTYEQWTIDNIPNDGAVLTLQPEGYVSWYECTRGGGLGHICPNVQHEEAARPVLYLKSSVRIVDGTGTSEDPFILTQ